MAQDLNVMELPVLLYFIGIGIPYILTYLITWLCSSSICHSRRHAKGPPLPPYWFPFLGHALSFLYNTAVVAEFQA